MQQCVKEPDTLRHLVKALRMRKVLYWHVTLHHLKLTTHLETELGHSLSQEATSTLTMQTRVTFHITHIQTYAGLSLAVSFPTLLN